jgi:hypothetical protein
MVHRRRPYRSYSTGQSSSSSWIVLLLLSTLVAVVVHGAWWLPSTSFSSSPSPKLDGAGHGGDNGHFWFPAWPNLMILNRAHYWKTIVAGRGGVWSGSSSSTAAADGDAAAAGKNNTAAERDNKTSQPPIRPVTYSRCRPFRLDAGHDAVNNNADKNNNDHDDSFWAECRPCQHHHPAAAEDGEVTFRDDNQRGPPSSSRQHHYQHTSFYITTESMLDPSLILAAGTHNIRVWHCFDFRLDSCITYRCYFVFAKSERERASMIKQCASRWDKLIADCRSSSTFHIHFLS